MIKNSYEHFSRSRKENSGCMGGLISMLDFRHHRFSQRLLSDKKCGGARNLDITNSRSEDDLPCNKKEYHEDAENVANLSDNKKEESYNAKFGVTSIKALMEEEMSRTWHFTKESNSKIELYEDTAKKNHNEISDYSNVSDEHFSDINVTEIMVDYCSNDFKFKDTQMGVKYKTVQHRSQESIEYLRESGLTDDSLAVFRMAILNIAQAILSSKDNTNLSKFSGNLEVLCEEDLISALEILNSNKSLFLKLLQDPDLPIRKLIQDQQNDQIGKSLRPNKNQFVNFTGSKQLQKQSDCHFFRKREKQANSNGWNGSKAAKKFVILRPNASKNINPSQAIRSISSFQSQCGLEKSEDGRSLSTHLSLKEIKRRFIVAVGGTRKEKHLIAMDGILNKIPYKKQRSSVKESSCRTELEENRDKMTSNIRETQNKNVLSFYTKLFNEHKELNKNDATQKACREAAFHDEVRKHLSELLLVNRKNELDPFPSKLSLPKEIGSESSQQNISTLICNSNQNLNTKCLSPSRKKENSLDCTQTMKIKAGTMEITETDDCVQIEEDSQGKAEFVPINNDCDLHIGNIDEEESSQLVEPEIIEESSQLSAPPTPTTSCFVLPEEPKDSKHVINSTGRPSPISVLEPLYLECLVSPVSSIIEHGINGERITCSREAKIDISAESSGSIDSESNTVACMQLDEAVLFDELETSYGLLINDPKLLFDLIDAIITEIKETHFSCSPWTPFLRPSIRILRRQQDFIKEACKKFTYHLDFQFPRTLEHVVKKGMDGGAWFNLHLEAENAVTEIGNVILDYLIEETAQLLRD